MKMMVHFYRTSLHIKPLANFILPGGSLLHFTLAGCTCFRKRISLRAGRKHRYLVEETVV